MKTLIKLSTILILLLAISGCSEKVVPRPCPKQSYPEIVAIDKIEKDRSITFKEDGSLSIEDGQKLGRMVQSFFIMQDYYFGEITGYGLLVKRLEAKDKDDKK